MASSVLKKENVIESEMVEMESRENYAKVKFVAQEKCEIELENFWA